LNSAGQASGSNEKTALQPQSVYFKYTGKTGMTVIGRETRTYYRFENPGAVVAVDARDKTAFLHVPHLRLVEGLPEA
jgi:hypothetical protein